jgi:hypothetical protein
MSQKTAFANLSTASICAACQRRALAQFHANHPTGANEIAIYCATTRRALALIGHGHEIRRIELSKPNDRDILVEKWETYLAARVEALEVGQAVHERNQHDGALH